jgi:dethiobiotin synthetase
MDNAYFLTGTDTEVGKTVITEGFLRLAAKSNIAVGYKPIASDAALTPDGLRNDDALCLQKASSIALSYREVNPYVFQPPLSPHVAAKRAKIVINEAVITKGFQRLVAKSDVVFVEGAGGWHVPISDRVSLSAWVIEQKLPVILVVGLKLGCLNHALLTAQGIVSQGGQLAGWIANHSQPILEAEYDTEMLSWLKANVPCPCLGIVPYLEKGQSASDYLILPQ